MKQQMDSDDDIGDESATGTMSQNFTDKNSPRSNVPSVNQAQSPVLYYGERTRESFSVQGVAPGSKLRQSKF